MSRVTSVYRTSVAPGMTSATRPLVSVAPAARRVGDAASSCAARRATAPSRCASRNAHSATVSQNDSTRVEREQLRRARRATRMPASTSAAYAPVVGPVEPRGGQADDRSRRAARRAPGRRRAVHSCTPNASNVAAVSPVLQRRLLEILEAVQARRHPVAASRPSRARSRRSGPRRDAAGVRTSSAGEPRRPAATSASSHQAERGREASIADGRVWTQGGWRRRPPAHSTRGAVAAPGAPSCVAQRFANPHRRFRGSVRDARRRPSRYHPAAFSCPTHRTCPPRSHSTTTTRARCARSSRSHPAAPVGPVHVRPDGLRLPAHRQLPHVPVRGRAEARAATGTATRCGT